MIPILNRAQLIPVPVSFIKFNQLIKIISNNNHKLLVEIPVFSSDSDDAGFCLL